MKSQIGSNFQKKIKDYVISYCPSEYLGKSIHGEMRTGYRSRENKIVIFRIAPLPLTPLLTQFLQLQQQYSDLSGFARVTHQPLHSSSNHYVPLEYFPKTFHSQRALFKANPKYMDEYVEKFLRVYAFFYNMRIAHGNLTAHNIGITFQGRVKLMDFTMGGEKFQERAAKDFQDFKLVIGMILEKDDHFPAKFNSFNSEEHSWQHLFSNWHITSPLEPVYLLRKGYVDNIVTLLHKLFEAVEEVEQAQTLRVALRFLMLNYLINSKDDEHERQAESLGELLGQLGEWQSQKYNSVLVGAIKDPQYYGLSAAHRLILISCLITKLNHQYLFFQITNQFANQDRRRNQILGDSLFAIYRYDILNNLLRAR